MTPYGLERATDNGGERAEGEKCCGPTLKGKRRIKHTYRKGGATIKVLYFLKGLLKGTRRDSSNGSHQSTTCRPVNSGASTSLHEKNTYSSTRRMQCASEVNTGLKRLWVRVRVTVPGRANCPPRRVQREVRTAFALFFQGCVVVDRSAGNFPPS